MSANDLANMDLYPVIIITAIIMFFCIVLGVMKGKSTANKVNEEIYGSNSDTQVKKASAKIVAKRTTPHPLNNALIINMVVFEFSDQSRIELAIKDPSIYGTMVEGDAGSLEYCGKKFIAFTRGKA